MLSSIEKEGGAEEGQEMIFFKKGGIEWLNASFIFKSKSRSWMQITPASK